MITHYVDVQKRLAEIKDSIDSLHIDDADSELATCRAYCNQLLLDGTALDTTNTLDEDKRDMIVSMRTAVRNLQETTELCMTKAAEAYRSHFRTEEKEAFERLTDQLKQEYNAAAYRCFSAYHAASSLHDLLSRFNTDLLDAGYEAERAARSKDTDVGEHAGATAGTDPLRYDRDPVPGSLSP